MAARVQHVCDAEGASLAPGALDALQRAAGGDLRRGITERPHETPATNLTAALATVLHPTPPGIAF